MSLLRLIGDPAWEHWPWKHFKSPAAQYKVLPTFVWIEWTYRCAAYACLYHAKRTNGLPLWFSAWLCGTANDIFFMFMPFCDNFWQAQASVMITPRLPLYIVEMYATIIYISSTAARQFNLPYVSEAALTGLLAHVLYGVYDINGPPYLWWTWHGGDQAISQRQHNAPLGSSIWILTYIAIHSLLLRWTETNYARLSDDLKTFATAVLARLPAVFTTMKERLRLFEVLDGLRAVQGFLNHAKTRYGALVGWAMRIAFSGLVCTPLFMQAMGIVQILSLDKIGIPGQRSYRFILALYVALVARGFYKAHNSGALRLPKLKSTEEANKMLWGVTSVFYAVNVYLAFTGESEKHLSTGCHQTYNEQGKVIKDIMGYTREEFVTPNGPKGLGFSQHDYALVSKEEDGKPDPSGAPIVAPKNDHEWYTVRGVKRHDRAGDIKLLLFFSAIGMTSYTTAFLNLLQLPSYIK